MSAQQWSQAFNSAYADLQIHLEQHNRIPIDPYAATSPAEYFAVFSELFFERPRIIQQYYPEIYTLLVNFYFQDPAASF
jgi:MtfA peptidase